MAAIDPAIDVLENELRQKNGLLDLLLVNHSSGKNIVWGTESYEYLGKDFLHTKPIKPDAITGPYSKLIQPRAAKPLEEQRKRTKDKAEVFTPLRIVDKMNKAIDRSRKIKLSESNWQQYIKEIRLEITCGEAPFIVSRYNPTSHIGKFVKISNRVGFLDRKLQIVSKYCNKPKEWLKWAEVAYKSCYGYEWQGDNILIARENMLYTLIDYFSDKFERCPSLAVQKQFAEIISWNIFQMDGVKCVLPMSCRHETKVTLGEPTLFGEMPEKVEKYECEGCKFDRPDKHNGRYAKVMDWEKNKAIKFIKLIEPSLNKSK